MAKPPYSGNPLSVARHLYVADKEVKDLVIPDGVTAIPDFAFDGCNALTSITIPASVKNIGKGAFRGCTGLAEVTIPETVTSIGDEAFCNCVRMRKINLPLSTVLGNDVFKGCTMLKEF